MITSNIFMDMWDSYIVIYVGFLHSIYVVAKDSNQTSREAFLIRRAGTISEKVFRPLPDTEQVQ